MKWIKPNWPVKNIQAVSTLATMGSMRDQGTRANFTKMFGLVKTPLMLQQVHGTTIIELLHPSEDGQPSDLELKADGCYSQHKGVVCSVLTADCLPVLLSHAQGHFVAALHAGWRGLAAGILSQAIQNISKAYAISAREMVAWLGPAISHQAFTVGPEVKAAFLSQQLIEDENAFYPSKEAPGKYQACLYTLARNRLNTQGVTQIFGGDFCTFRDSARFYSYRRDGGTINRLATLIWKS